MSGVVICAPEGVVGAGVSPAANDRPDRKYIALKQMQITINDRFTFFPFGINFTKAEARTNGGYFPAAILTAVSFLLSDSLLFMDPKR